MINATPNGDATMTTLKRIWREMDLFDLSLLTSAVRFVFDLVD